MKAAIQRVLELSGADEVIVIGRNTDDTNLRWANTGLTTNGMTHDSYLAVISVIDGRAGTFAASLNEATDLEAAVRASERMARENPKSPDYVPLIKAADKWMVPDVPKTDPADIGRLSDQLGMVFSQAKTNKHELFGYGERKVEEYYLATSTGLRKAFATVQGQFELNAKTPDYKRSVWAGSSLKDFKDIDALQLYKTLNQKLDWSKNQIDLPAGKYEVILEPSAVADLLLYAYWSSSARTAEEGQSAFSARGGGTVIGRKLYNPDITIYSDPTEPGLETPPFNVVFASGAEESLFDNGLQLQRTDWVKDGVQTNLLATRFMAKRYGYQQAAPFIPNLIFKHEGASLEDMIRSTKQALLVTTVWYIREVDPQNLLLTGLTRDGVFLVEDGQVKGAVNNFRFNMSPLQMLKNTVEIGQSQSTLAREFGDYFPLSHIPPLRVKDFNMSSVSQAS